MPWGARSKKDVGASNLKFTAPTNMLTQGLVVFDYDWSLINDDSDYFVFNQLDPALHTELSDLLDSGAQWTKAVDATLAKLTCTKEKLINTVARVPVQPGMLDAIHLAHEKGWDVVIVSDANTVFIHSMLEHHNLTSIVTQVYTNPASFDGDILRVKPYYPLDKPAHGCPRCPSNMCKGSIVRNIRALKQYTKVLYVGDGKGDFCPASTELTSHDVLFARESYDLLDLIEAHQSQIKATVSLWNTGFDILAGFQAHLG
ncbi:Aste57867_24095 [Aphanomyces stellatus]|uniref:Aste57867_24095 protein n=1 Tax=Aphanomyces stellatus TaxID=120398 RepID=A0A485LPK8_9STRA|nr:hypothetical protein As57867_024022 [Aphanomyces stellatus]VFU00737.1 Aste57867_24095 [Aphanomyces stellatus]